MGLEYRSGIEQMEYAIFGCNFSPILLLPTSYFLNAEAAFKTVLPLLFSSMQFTSTMLLQNDRFASLRSCSLWIYILKDFNPSPFLFLLKEGFFLARKTYNSQDIIRFVENVE